MAKINIEELKKKLAKPMADRTQEALMASTLDINCKIPNELSGFLTDFLQLTTADEDALSVVNELYKLTPEQITIVATLAMIANGRVADFVRLERNMIILKLSVTQFIQDNMEYRRTSVDETEGNPEAILDSLIFMRKMINRIDNEKEE